MLDILSVIDLAKLLIGPNPILQYYGKVVHIPIYGAAASFVCRVDDDALKLNPIALRLIFEKTVSDTAYGKILSASITCSTRHQTGKMLGAQLCIESPTLEIYGRLRRSKCDRFLKPMCGSSFVTLSISSVLSTNSCNYCEFKGVAKRKSATCNSCRVPYFKIRS